MRLALSILCSIALLWGSVLYVESRMHATGTVCAAPVSYGDVDVTCTDVGNR